MKIDIITLFPEMFNEVFAESILKRACDKKLIEIKIHYLRNWAKDKHKTCDDIPYGGGAGMILKADIIDKALKDIKSKAKKQNLKIVITSPKGTRFNQNIAKKYSKIDNLIIICGHYGGVDARVLNLVDEEVSLGDFVLTGGEIPAMAITDAIVRLLPSVINKESLKNETHSVIGKNQYPQYTRPREFIPQSTNKKETLRVPEILLSGNHKNIQKWRNNN